MSAWVWDDGDRHAALEEGGVRERRRWGNGGGEAARWQGGGYDGFVG